jgi:Bifunctional DNA primase/polymerase, N-terminal
MTAKEENRPTGNRAASINTYAAAQSTLSAENLAAEALAIRELGASVIGATDIGVYAIEYGVRNWHVFPLRGKIPAIPGGRGVLDATTNIDQIAQWWGGRYAGCNIGGRVPESMIVLDIDPRHDGDRSIASLEDGYGPLPETLTTISGRGDGGRHLFFRRPPGKLTSKRLGPGVDLKTSTGYVVLAPSIHPDTRKPYVRVDAPVADPPAWVIELLAPEKTEKTAYTITSTRSRSLLPGHLSGSFSGSIADTFSQTATWSEILMPHGWSCLDGAPEADGAKWVHPTATAKWSATIRNGCLFVYSSNTAFRVTESGNPSGYTKFRAHAVLNHDGDLPAAARALMAVI